MTYQQKGIIEKDPFVTLDHRWRWRTGEASHPSAAGQPGPDIKLGICGEHGGDPASVKFCETIGLDYVSCSPFRVPIARLAAAAALSESDS
jgi:pyruvate,orthophosphate dikinase